MCMSIFKANWSLRVAFAAVLLLAAGSAYSQTSTSGRLRAGAAKVDITRESDLALPTDVIRDHVFTRVILVDDGSTCALLVNVDTAHFDDGLLQETITKAAAATGCPAQNIVISATHTHSATTGARDVTPDSFAPIEKAIVSAAQTAKSRLAPARVGYGTTKLDLNVNRDLFNSKFEWREEPNPDGLSDKTLAVVALIGADEVPIGVYLNYPMHPVNFFMSGVLSADFPGEAARYVEELFDNRAVAVFSQGAAGDQDPKLFLSPSTLFVARRFLSEPRRFVETVGPQPTPWGAAGGGRKPVPPENMAAYKKFIANTSNYVVMLGTQIGSSAVQVMREMRPTDAARIRAAQDTVTCPGRDRVQTPNQPRENVLPEYKDGPDVKIRVGLLRIGDIHFVTVNGEVYTRIAMRLKAESPASQTMMVTVANGRANSGYIYSDDAFGSLVFQVVGSRLKPGCAEAKIVSKAIELMHRSDQP
jgi:neutral ceramidase